MAREQAGAGPRLVTTLDPAAQQAVVNILRGRTSWLHAQGIGSVAAVVLDPVGRDVLAMCNASVPPALMDRINAAILVFRGTDRYRALIRLQTGHE